MNDAQQEVEHAEQAALVHFVILPVEYLPGQMIQAQVSSCFYSTELAEIALAHVRQQWPQAKLCTCEELRPLEAESLKAKAAVAVPLERQRARELSEAAAMASALGSGGLADDQ